MHRCDRPSRSGRIAQGTVVSELLTVIQGAERLFVSRSTFYRLVAERKIRLTKVRGRSFVTEAELERYLATAQRRSA